MQWSSDDLARLASMRQQGKSFGQLAVVFASTRSAIAGVVYRQKIDGPGPRRPAVRTKKVPERSMRIPASNSKPKPAPAPPKIPLRAQSKRIPRVSFRAWEEAEALALSRKLFGPNDPLPLMHVGRGMCRFPVGEDPKVVGLFLFCARACEPESAYCPLHAEKMHQAPRSK